jgi:hypothetical protein
VDKWKSGKKKRKRIIRESKTKEIGKGENVEEEKMINCKKKYPKERNKTTKT